jgi:hypothetical protein
MDWEEKEKKKKKRSMEACNRSPQPAYLLPAVQGVKGASYVRMTNPSPNFPLMKIALPSFLMVAHLTS